MEIPDSLQQKIELFRETGAVFRHQEELFTEAAWVQVMLGQGIMPQDFNPLSRTISASDLAAFLQNMRTIIDNAVGKMPTHNQYLAHLG